MEQEGNKEETTSFEKMEEYEPMTTRLRGIIRQYPDGSQLKEFLQNAEDAKAKNLVFILDYRSFDRTEDENLNLILGPSLLVYNSGIFTNEDFKGLASVGESNKKKDPTKTGRFGLGFRSCYHMTDFPSVVSGKYFVILDPHKKLKNDIGSLKIPFGKENWSEKHPVETNPFCVSIPNVFDCDMKSDFNGSLFRFPLRSSDAAKVSKILNKEYKMDTLEEHLHFFEKEIVHMMLFLKYVQQISVYEIRNHTEGPKKLFECKVQNLSQEVQEGRMKVLKFLETVKDADRVDWRTEVQSFYPLSLEYFHSSDSLVQSFSYKISQHCGGEVLGSLANKFSQSFSDTQWIPWTAVAIPVTEKDKNPVGSASCLLPFDLSTGFPFNLNAFFQLDSQRRNIWVDHKNELKGEEKAKADWNEALGVQIAKLFVDCLLGYQQETNENLFDLWPTSHWQKICQNIYSILKSKKMFSSSWKMV